MGVEGFSHAHHLGDMNHITGGRNELIWLFGFMLLFPLAAYGRKSNEDGIHEEIKTTNRYARMKLDKEAAQPSKWSA